MELREVLSTIKYLKEEGKDELALKSVSLFSLVVLTVTGVQSNLP